MQRLQRVLTAWIGSGLGFMLLPGTFLGVWNLIRISGTHSGDTVARAWIQAHGHAQVFGWIGSFILGIGFYSLSKMGEVAPGWVRRAWISWCLWSTGVALHWAVGVYGWYWRVLLPLSAALELAGLCIFLVTVRKHRPSSGSKRMPVWIALVLASTFGFFLSVAANLGVGVWLALRNAGPAVPPEVGQGLLALFTWGFIVPAIWGFNARWLPGLLHLPKTRERLLVAALAATAIAVTAALCGAPLAFALLAACAAVASIAALRIWSSPASTGIFSIFVRLAYVWLLVAAGLSIWAALGDRAGGIWGASRHALTVGFVSTMTFSIGQRLLPEFTGMRRLFSPRLMAASLAVLNLGCLLRVASEIPAYEGWLPGLWPVLPVSALIEMAAFTLFATNLVLTRLRCADTLKSEWPRFPSQASFPPSHYPPRPAAFR